MLLRASLIERILKVQPDQFDALALDIARFQYRNNPLYRQYCDLLRKIPDNINDPSEIAFLPIQFFKQTLISSNARPPEIVFESSTTTGSIPGRHGLWAPALYAAVAQRGFEHVIGQRVSEMTWLALLPSYLERPNASLVAMMRGFIDDGRAGSGFFLDDYDNLMHTIRRCEAQQIPVILIGVSFAILDLCDQHQLPLHYTRVFETGGMKGRRNEMTRDALHTRIRKAFCLDVVGSEYGMTELLSQAWSVGDGVFQCAPTLRVYTREIQDPLQLVYDQRGAINCIDLANIDSCSFIATDDIGCVAEDGTFQVLGRLDGTDQRGCNLMVADIMSE